MGLVADKDGAREDSGTGAPPDVAWDLPEEERGRAETYRLLGLLLSSPPREELIRALGALPEQDTDIGRAMRAIGRIGQASGEGALRSEYNDLFVGLPVPRFMPYASQYMNGQLFGRALAELRMDLAGLGIARNDDATEPEDHVGTLCEIMAGLITGAFGRPPLPVGEQAAFFRRHIDGWADQFFEDLAGSESSNFYMAVARLGSVFVRLEAESFAYIEA